MELVLQPHPNRGPCISPLSLSLLVSQSQIIAKVEALSQISLPLLPESYLSLVREGRKSPKVRTLVLIISSQSLYLGEMPEVCIPWAKQPKIKDTSRMAPSQMGDQTKD